MNGFSEIYDRIIRWVYNIPYDKHMSNFNRIHSKNRKRVFDANIVGMTLNKAEQKISPIIIRPLVIDGVEQLCEQCYTTGRVNVVVPENIVTRIISFA